MDVQFLRLLSLRRISLWMKQNLSKAEPWFCQRAPDKQQVKTNPWWSNFATVPQFAFHAEKNCFRMTAKTSPEPVPGLTIDANAPDLGIWKMFVFIFNETRKLDIICGWIWGLLFGGTIVFKLLNHKSCKMTPRRAVQGCCRGSKKWMSSSSDCFPFTEFLYE